MRARRLAQSKRQQLGTRVPDEKIPRVEEIAMAQSLEAAQRLSRCDESGSRIDGKMPLEFRCRDVQSGLWGLAAGDGVCCRLVLA